MEAAQDKIDQLQKTQLGQNPNNIHYEKIETGFTDQAKTSRKRHRDLKCKADASEESDANEMFQLEVEDAFDKYGQKRKKKHMYNEEGVKFEPFNIRQDVEDGLITQDGVVKKLQMQEEDPWLQSINAQQEQMLKEEQAKANSDASESSSEEN